MTVEDAIRSRVSVKEYQGDPVPEQTVQRLLELATLAPNHRMTEPVRFRVMGPGAKLAYAEALAGRKTANLDDPAVAEQVRDKVVRRTTTVPTMIAVLVHQDENPEIREEDYATAFMGVQNLSLAAIEMGLGTHIKTGAVMEEPELRRALKVGDDQRIAAVVFLGEPAEIPDSKQRMSPRELTEWLE